MFTQRPQTLLLLLSFLNHKFSPFVLQWYLQYVEPFTHLTIHLKWSVLY